MPRIEVTSLAQDLEAVFNVGTFATLSDGLLLERFLEGHECSSERAFETLVTRHGPMVYRLCRQILGDEHEAHDAFQAVFLILARRAGSVRRRESLGSWLHGVAMRVAARARRGLTRRRRRELHPEEPFEQLEAPELGPGVVAADTAAIIHREVARLPEKYRAPIVLCYLEGLTHDEAAIRLNWPVGTVRSRLARARDRLRQQLGRRGLSRSAALGAMVGFLGVEVGSSRAGAIFSSSRFGIPRELIVATIRAASQTIGGKPVAVGLISVATMTLSKEISRTMVLERVVTLALAILPMGILTLTGGTMLGKPTAPGPRAKPPASSRTQDGQKARIPTAQPARPADPLALELLKASRERYESQRLYFEAGRITIDRFVTASTRLMEVERLVATTDEERVSAMERHVDRLKLLEASERKRLEEGTATTADVSEAVQDRLEAEFLLRETKRAKPVSDVAGLNRRLSELEAKLDALARQLDRRDDRQK
jgi:RNA polymerase sigma factor (sigma-70 family)